MVVLFIQIIMIALLAAFILCLMRKWGAIEYVQVHGNAFFSQMFNCNFCLSWWACCTIAVAWAAVYREPSVIITPLFSTMITRALL